MVTQHPEGVDQRYENPRPYDRRGWTRTEQALSSIRKSADCLIDTKLFDAQHIEAKVESGKRQQLERGCGPLGTMEEALLRLHIMIKLCKPERKPPVTPIAFNEWLDESVSHGTISFTSNADIKIVSTQYMLGFYGSLTSTPSLDMRGLKWDDEQLGLFLVSLCDAAKYKKEKDGLSLSLARLRLHKNRLTDQGMRKLLDILDRVELPGLAELNIKKQEEGYGFSDEMIKEARTWCARKKVTEFK